jgi:hypothetical protein
MLLFAQFAFSALCTIFLIQNDSAPSCFLRLRSRTYVVMKVWGLVRGMGGWIMIISDSANKKNQGSDSGWQ